jgi:hypothetical protein
MATVAYTFVSVCDGGGHTTLGVSLNGAAAQNVVYVTDDVRAPLSALTQDEREKLALLVLKVHCAGKTRAQISSEFQAGPVTVTI